MSKVFTVLIVEDSDSKRASIQTVLEREIPGVKLRHAVSVKSGIDAVLAETPDMIIADMSLPTFDVHSRERGGSPRPFGGFEVFETLDRYKIVVPVLVVTSYESITDGENSIGLADLSARLSREFPDNFKGTVHFDSIYATWERKLASFLKTTFESSNDS